MKQNTHIRYNNAQHARGMRLIAFICAWCMLMPYPGYSFEQDAAYISEFSTPRDTSSIEQYSISGDIIQPSLFLRSLADIISTPGAALTVPLLRTASDSASITLVASGLPEGALIVNGHFVWTPQESQEGTYTITIAAQNNTVTLESQSFSVEILASLSQQELNALPDSAEIIEVEIPVVEDAPETSENGNGISPVSSSGTSVSAYGNIPDRALSDTTEPEVENNTENDEVIEGMDETDDTPSTETPLQGVVPAERIPHVTSGWSTQSSFRSSAQTSSSSTTTTSGSSISNSSSSQPIVTAFGSSGVLTGPLAPNTPLLDDPGVASFNGGLVLEWSDVSAPLYEVQQAPNAAFTVITKKLYPTTTQITLTDLEHPRNGYYYYRVRAWSGPETSGGVGSNFSNVVTVGIDYERDIDVLQFPVKGIFTEIPGAPGTSIVDTNDSSAYSNPVEKITYDLTKQADQSFAGVFFKQENGVDISTMHTLNIRLRGDDIAGYPVRMIIEMKYQGAVQGVLFVTGLTGMYQDIALPFYVKNPFIDEVVLFMEDDSQGDGDGAVYVDELFFSEQKFVPDILPQIEETSGPSLSDKTLLDKVEADTARFFYYEIVGPGYVKDTSTTTYSSVAATGFGLAALTVCASRYGTSAQWTITPDAARTRIGNILDGLLEVQSKQIVNPELYGTEGFFYHFMDGEGKRAIDCEVSVVDSALLVAGALTAGEYFGGDIKEKADALYAAMNWVFFLQEDTVQYYMGWRPESTRGFTTPKGSGFISSATFNKPTDEVLLIALLALGNHVNNPLIRKAYFGYPRESATYTAETGNNAGTTYEVVNSYFGSLFTYLYAHCFFDFKTLGYDQAYMAQDAPYPVSIDWWENSVQAFKANRQFCMDQGKNYPFAYSGSSWGISAVQRPDGRYEGRYGAVPFDNGPGQDGTVALYAPLSAFPFFRESDFETLADNEAFQALRFYYYNYYDQVYGPYGFYDSFDNKGNFSSVYLGLDQGPIVLMIENYRSGLLWNTLANNEKLSTALSLIFAKSFDWVDVQVKNIADNTDAQELSFGDNPAGTTIASSGQYVQVSYNFQYPTGKLVIYTDNTKGTIPYTGAGNAAGMVGMIDPATAVPLLWTVFDERRAGGYQFAGLNAEGIMQDMSEETFLYPESIERMTLADGFGNLGMYPSMGRTVSSDTVYLYFGCDFTNAPAQSYTTDTITIDIYHE